MTCPTIQQHPHGITTIDTRFMRPGLVASHLLVERGQAVFIDVGTSTNLSQLLQSLTALELRPESVRAVIVTHIHLDHAGCAGTLLEHLPEASLIVHPRGARHMIDPQQLVAGAKAVYGEQVMRDLIGDIKPVAQDRVIEAQDGFSFDLNGRELLFIDTPGHARHHFCVYDKQSASFFTGDTFGLSYREFDNAHGPFIMPTSTPIHFDPAALHQSIKRLIAMAPKQMFLTHFGCVKSPAHLAGHLHQQIDQYVDIALSAKQSVDPLSTIIEQLQALLIKQLAAHGCKLTQEEIIELMTMDINLNAQGLAYWLKSQG